MVFVLWLPFVFRLLILAKPMRETINELSLLPDEKLSEKLTKVDRSDALASR